MAQRLRGATLVNANTISTVLHRTVVLALVCAGCDASAEADDQPAPPDAAPVAAAPAQPAWLDSARRAEERELYSSAAAAAWSFADRNYVPATGLIRPFDTYSISTMWDIASGLAALYCASELGLITAADYDQRMRKALGTLAQLPLFDDLSFNKEYDVTNGGMIGITRAPSRRGYGVSALDTGRFLMWLRIIGQKNPEHAALTRKIVDRLQVDELIDDEYLSGRQLSRRTNRVRAFQEGRIGYEQYAAAGYAAWGHAADHALDIDKNAEDVEVSGVTLPADRRGNDRLTSEPFILLGLEYGWREAERRVAERVLRAQEKRAQETGRIVMVSEDAINIAPDYFFYNTVYSKHGPWSIDVQRPGVKPTGPRWLSAKAAFGWHALLPQAYTRQAVELVRSRALAGGVWGAGVFDNGQPTANPNINTAAVILESALYR